MRLIKYACLNMGTGNSKVRNRGGKKKTEKEQVPTKVNDVNARDNITTDFGAAYDPELSRMRRSLEKDQQGFILNNLMLCVQFFENYDQEILDIRARPVSREESDLNTILSQSQKHVLLPDVLQEQVARHVKFTSARQTEKLTVEPLQPVRMFIVLDNVDVNEIAEGPEYTLLTDVIVYNMCLESSRNQGFVKLRSLEVTPAMKGQANESSDSDLSSIAEDDDEIYNGEDMFEPRDNPGLRFLSKVEKHANSMGKPIITKSLTDLRHRDGANEEINRVQSQTNLTLQGQSAEESPYGGTSERRLSGRIKPPSNAVLRAQLGQHKKLNELKSRHQNTQQQIQQSQRSAEASPASSVRSSGYRSGSSGNNYVIDSDSDYGYATITSFNTPKPLVRPANIPASSSEIPATCFKKIVYTRDGKVYSEKAERIQLQNRQQRRIRKALQRQNEDRLYLRSDKFMHYFQDLFANRLAGPLRFETEDVDEATRQGAIIYCDTVDFLEKNRTLIVPYEIVPSIPAAWPECGDEWLHRVRPEILDPASSVIYVWPTSKMIQKVKKFGCHIIPEGYMPKRQTNPNHALEWQLTFPAVERYLETCLSHAQVRVYLLALMLHKTFIRPVDTTFGLTTSHIRTQLFWLLEQNYSPSMWPENRAGDSLRRLLKKLYASVSQTQPCLPDYFLSKKNLFANIPKQYLLLTQKQLNRIIDNPVMYVLTSMENIRYKPEFFPVLDYKKLFKILTVESNDLMGVINPALTRVDRPLATQPQVEEMEIFDERFDRVGGFWVKVKTKEDPLYERVQKSIQHKNVLNRSNKGTQQLVVEISQRCGELQGLRLVAFLDMFVKHFIQMAERCYHYGSTKQKDVYLNQAERLTMILYEQANGKEDAKRYLDEIGALRQKLSRPKPQRNAPEIPRRNDQPIISVPMNQHFADGSEAPGVGLFVPYIGETKEYDIYYAPTQRRPTVNFQNQTTELEHDGTVTIGEVNDVTLKSPGPNTPRGKGQARIVSLVEETEDNSFLTDSTYI
ncbi:uncharacterized protein LOC105693756 [Athalia rosae]|uniref:uncharacterized protein LOC105693756 n=1 Tax=Athalia rosae TaxID=37344 RepID=UPI0020334FEF|nr:uncharacterized protein LOC105693756 [Athalia rosae]